MRLCLCEHCSVDRHYEFEINKEMIFEFNSYLKKLNPNAHQFTIEEFEAHVRARFGVEYYEDANWDYEYPEDDSIWDEQVGEEIITYNDMFLEFLNDYTWTATPDNQWSSDSDVYESTYYHRDSDED